MTTFAEAAQNNSATDLIDLWVPIVNDLAIKLRKGGSKSCLLSCTGEEITGDRRSDYDFVKPGNLWTYQSCMSYGSFVPIQCPLSPH